MGCGKSRTAPVSPEGGHGVALQQQNDEDIRDKYELGRVLGSGSFGQVREATMRDHLGGGVRAVKVIERDGHPGDGEWSNQAIFVREVSLLQHIDHDNIIRYYDFYEDVHFLYVVMELCQGGEVFAKIVELKRFGEKDAAVLGQQMLRAISYIHNLHIVHRDIKAENFMLAGPTLQSPVKMIDFGMACRFEEGECLTELCGSPHYLAPELIGQRYNHLADIWAFGVLLYLIMYGHYPFDAKSPRDIMVKILTEPVRWQTKAKLSRSGLEFLRRLLEHDPRKRANVEEALQHSWMQLANVTAAAQDAEALPAEVIRNAHKKVTATRKHVDRKVEEVRNEKLRRIDEDFSRGIRRGQRLGETPKEEFMSKPEFLRRENKITTAPSSAGREFFTSRRASLKRLLDGHRPNKGGAGPKLGDLQAIDESGLADAGGDGASAEDRGAGVLPTPSIRPQGGGKQWRSQSVSAGSSPKRLSYIGALSCQEERSLASMYAEKRKSTDGTAARGPAPPGDPAKPTVSSDAPDAPTEAAGRPPQELS